MVGIAITLALLLVAAYLGRLLLRPAMNPSAE
jgi:UPF0716 family protein affecting phage T7 exclusion